jgi:hypothetical protein
MKTRTLSHWLRRWSRQAGSREPGCAFGVCRVFGWRPGRRAARMAEYANRQSGQVESLVIVCGFDSHLGYSNGPRW